MTWSLSVYRAHGARDAYEHTTHRLSSAARVREEHALESARPWVSRITLTEHVREVTRRPLAYGEMPAPRATADPSAPDAQHGARHYEAVSLDLVPFVLPDADAVHAFWDRPPPADESSPLCLIEVTVLESAREITLDELPSLGT
ncbi:hypothetical protein [Streptomyces sp. NBC_01601]|uniref:hypothetical protein n=1 Tax=Streptomyces sp. NBC_01601 TaxID=2975892 RepID=UPI002E2DCAC9|nr:hypothetical protein [Streptomyces sp. NBC_01601]